VLERWEPVDDELRDEAAGAAARAASGRPTPNRSTPGRSAAAAPRRRTAPVDPEVAAAITAAAADRRVAERMIGRLAQAQDALDRDRLDEARRLIASVLKAVPGIAAVHEVSGLVAYRSGRWRQAVRELETAQELTPNIALVPVLADSYRALGRWSDVERLWRQVREASPAHEVLAEARMVAAGALADQGDLAGALATMARVPADPKRVRDHHLRQWYVLGDLHDRAGNALEAARWFERVARQDPDFVDVAARLRSLGRRS